MQATLVLLLTLAIPFAMAFGFSALMRRVYGVGFLAGVRWAFANRHPEIALPLLLVMLIWIGLSWGLARQSIDGLFSQVRTVIVLGRTREDLYAVDVHAPGQGVSRYEGLGSLAQYGIAAPPDSLEGLFVPLVLWRSPFAADYTSPVQLDPLVSLFLSVVSLGMLAVSFAVGGIAMAAASTGRLPPEGSAFGDVSRRFRAVLGRGLGHVMAVAALAFALMLACITIGYVRLSRGMPLARGQAQELQTELFRTLSPGAVVRGTVVAREQVRAAASMGEAGPPTSPLSQESACYHVRLDVLALPVFLGYTVADAPGPERDELEEALRLGGPIEFVVTEGYGIRRQ